MRPLEGRIALVAGATRGAGRAIAVTLGEAGATVYCTGRSVRGQPASGPTRPETLDETAELVDARAGIAGRGIAMRVDHTVESEVEALCARIEKEQGQLDIVVNDVWGGESLTEFGRPFWELDSNKGRTMLERGIVTHILTSRHAVPLMLKCDRRRRGILIEVTDGAHFGYRGSLFYDLVKLSVIRMAFAMAHELRNHPVTALAVTPGFLRSEEMLDHFGVSEANWQEGAKKEPHFIASETPYYVARAIAALAADSNVASKAGRVFSSWDLAREYGFTDIDGRTPHWGEHFVKAVGRPFPVVDEADYEAWKDPMVG